MLSKLFFFILLFFLSFLARAQVVQRMDFDRFSHYAPDDWITYAPATEISDVDLGDEFVYFATRNGGILRYHFYEHYWDFPFTTSTGLRSNRILHITFDIQTHQLYAETPKGIDVFNPGFGFWQPAPRASLPARQQPLPAEIQAYRQNPNFHFPEFYRPSNKELPDFFMPRGYIFESPNIIRDPFNRSFKLKAARITDRFGRLWLSTNGLGIGRCSPDDWTLYTEQHSISNISVRDIFIDSQGIWIGGISKKREPNGIVFWNDSLDIWNYYEARYDFDLLSSNVQVIASNGPFVFFGTELGLVKYAKKTRTWSAVQAYSHFLSEPIYDLKMMDGRLFIASGAGLGWMYPDDNTITLPKDKTINTLEVHQIAALDSVLLLATDYGLYKYHPKTDRFSFFKIGAALPEYGASAVNTYGDSLWIAGSSGIIFFNMKSKEWFSFTQLQRQLRAHFFDIAFSGPFVWFATNKGLLRYDTVQNYWYLYTRKDGLASNKVYHIEVDGDMLWLSTGGGVTTFLWQKEGRME